MRNWQVAMRVEVIAAELRVFLGHALNSVWYLMKEKMGECRWDVERRMGDIVWMFLVGVFVM